MAPSPCWEGAKGDLKGFQMFRWNHEPVWVAPGVGVTDGGGAEAGTEAGTGGFGAAFGVEAGEAVT